MIASCFCFLAAFNFLVSCIAVYPIQHRCAASIPPICCENGSVVLTALMCRLFSKLEVDIVCHVPRQHLHSKSATFCKPHEPLTPPRKQTSLPKF